MPWITKVAINQHPWSILKWISSDQPPVNTIWFKIRPTKCHSSPCLDLNDSPWDSLHWWLNAMNDSSLKWRLKAASRRALASRCHAWTMVGWNWFSGWVDRWMSSLTNDQFSHQLVILNHELITKSSIMYHQPGPSQQYKWTTNHPPLTINKPSIYLN